MRSVCHRQQHARDRGQAPVAPPRSPGRPARGHHEAVPGRRRQQGHRAHRRPGHGPRDRRRERRRQVDADEDPLRRPAARRGHDRGRRQGASSCARPSDAIAAGHRHGLPALQLADNLTVLENVVLGAEKLHGIGDAARAKIREISDAYGLEVRPGRARRRPRRGRAPAHRDPQGPLPRRQDHSSSTSRPRSSCRRRSTSSSTTCAS